MSIGTVEVIIDRIKSARGGSEIAVFSDRSTGALLLDAKFANTVETMKRIRNKDPDLIGVWDDSCNLADVRKHLIMYLKGSY